MRCTEWTNKWTEKWTEIRRSKVLRQVMCRVRPGKVLVLSVMLAYADLVQADAVEFSYFNLSLQDSHYYLDAQVAVELNNTIEAGLKSGVPLYFDAKGKIFKIRPFLWDLAVGSFERRFSLVYYELTRHYRVSAVGEDATRNFRSLFDALEYLGSIQRLPVVSQEILGQSDKYRGEFSFALDTGALPLQLTTQTLVSSAWRLRSENYQWPIN